MTTTNDEIRMSAEGLSLGETARQICPVCRGGSSGERSMNVTRSSDGILFVCHRASCGVKGFFNDSGVAPVTASAKRPQETSYKGAVSSVNDKDIAYFERQYELPRAVVERNIRVAEDGRYVLPVRTSLDREVAIVLRRPWEGAPRAWHGKGPKTEYRSHGMMEWPAMAFYNAQRYSKPAPSDVVLVEDQLSAIKLAHFTGACAVALLGTDINAEKARLIAELGFKRVIIALDADATGKAFMLARDWGLAWNSCRVAILKTDIKDMYSEDIRPALGIS